MTQRNHTFFFILIIVAFGLLMLTGCGRKGPPLPPLKEAPAQAETEKKEEEVPPPSGPAKDPIEGGKHETPAVPPYP